MYLVLVSFELPLSSSILTASSLEQGFPAPYTVWEKAGVSRDQPPKLHSRRQCCLHRHMELHFPSPGLVCCPGLSPRVRSQRDEGLLILQPDCEGFIPGAHLSSLLPLCCSPAVVFLPKFSSQHSGSSWCLLLSAGRAQALLSKAPLAGSVSAAASMVLPGRQSQDLGTASISPLQGQGLPSFHRFRLHGICKMQFSYILSHQKNSTSTASPI